MWLGAVGLALPQAPADPRWQALLGDYEKPASPADLKAFKVHIAELTHIVEQEIHAVVIVARVLREQEGAMEEKTELTMH